MTDVVESYISRASSDPNIDLNMSDLDRHTALHLAVSGWHTAILEILVNAGADLNVVDRLQRTPLHWSIMHKNHHAAEYLLEAGAEVGLEDHFEETPLDVSFNRKWDLAVLLMRHGASHKPNRIQTALYAAAMYGTADLIKRPAKEARYSYLSLLKQTRRWF